MWYVFNLIDFSLGRFCISQDFFFFFIHKADDAKKCAVNMATSVKVAIPHYKNAQLKVKNEKKQ